MNSLIKNRSTMVNYKKYKAIAIFMGLSSSLFGQDVSSSASDPNFMSFLLNNIIFVLSGLVILFFGFTMLRLITQMLELQKIRLLQEQGIDIAKRDSIIQESLWQKVNRWAWSLVPISEEKSIDLGHDYDGIRELDNKLPPWWLWTFYGSILFAFAYMYIYHFSGSDWSSIQEYELEVKKAKEAQDKFLAKMANTVDENSVAALTDAASLEEGKGIYALNCVACHADDGRGTVGPNFCDPYWINGGGIKNIFKTIKYGVPEKGMISWKSQLNPSAMQKVASYILTFQGTNPPNQKAPEGDLWEDDSVKTTSAKVGE